MRRVFAAIAAMLLATSLAYAETDEEAFKARVAQCTTHGCLLDLSVSYFTLHEDLRALEILQGCARKEREMEVARARGALHDAEFIPLYESGGWEKMSEAEKQDWMAKRWGPAPKALMCHPLFREDSDNESEK